MKKFLLALPVLATLVLTSCQKERINNYFDEKSPSVADDNTSGLRGGGGSGDGGLYGGVEVGGLLDKLFVFTDGKKDGNWQGATKGFVGDVAIKGTILKEKTSGTVPYAGIITTNDHDLDVWQEIVNDNVGQASALLHEPSVLNQLEHTLENAFLQINDLPVTPGFAGITPQSLNGYNSQNGIAEIFVININSDLQVSTKINITGDVTDLYFMRWDTDQDFSNGYNGQVKFKSGGAIVPMGGLNAASFVHVAGEISSSGGGENPAAPYPQGPRLNDGAGNLINGGSDFNGGGFFTGYWFTTGKPSIFQGNRQPYGETPSLSNAIFVGGWYSTTTKFSMTSGTSGVHKTKNTYN